jgi:hypothetical protein
MITVLGLLCLVTAALIFHRRRMRVLNVERRMNRDMRDWVGRYRSDDPREGR